MPTNCCPSYFFAQISAPAIPRPQRPYTAINVTPQLAWERQTLDEVGLDHQQTAQRSLSPGAQYPVPRLDDHG